MMRWTGVGALAGLLLTLTPAGARAEFRFFPFRSEANRLIDEAKAARERDDLRLATSLLDMAAAEPGAPRERLLHQRGLLARDRGDLNTAADLLEQAADAEPTSSARVDQAAVLVQLGRWPEAVVVLGKAYDERGSSLPVQEVVSDRRFIKLAGFEPYEKLNEKVRAEQAGPFGRLLLKLERIDASARTAKGILERLSTVLAVLGRLVTAVGAPVILLILFGLVLTFGVSQLGLLEPPWTLVTGMGIASVLWHFGARIATADASSGERTIGLAMGIVFGPWLLVLAVRAVLRWRRRARLRALDPFAQERLPATLELLEHTAAACRRVLESSGGDQEAAVTELRQTSTALRRRLRATPAEGTGPAAVERYDPGHEAALGQDGAEPVS